MITETNKRPQRPFRCDVRDAWRESDEQAEN